jgi:hypothetical protein
LPLPRRIEYLAILISFLSTSKLLFSLVVSLLSKTDLMLYIEDEQRLIPRHEHFSSGGVIRILYLRLQ